MIKKFIFLQLLFLIPFIGISQNLFKAKNHRLEVIFHKDLYNTDSSYHTGLNLNSPVLNPHIQGAQQNHKESLKLGYKSWFGRKAFDQSLAFIKGDNYEFRIDPIVNFQFGSESQSDGLKFRNTRGISIEGRLGKKVTFASSFVENQAIFPSYIDDFTKQWQVVPQMGHARKFGDSGHDFTKASGEFNYQPNDIFILSVGQGNHFFGEGYRSMQLSDATFNYPFFRVQTQFGRVKYVNLWAQLFDVTGPESSSLIFLKKSMASHYLSIDITNRWNLSFFESIILADTLQQRKMDVSFFNPIIFYRPVEYAVGSGTGNALLGLSSSYKIKNGYQVYGQFVLDEFTASEFFANDGYWANKYGIQLGLKAYDFLGIEGLFSRFEFNTAPPYTYSHLVSLRNYAHYSQSLAHPWGANFEEYLMHLQYNHKRWEFELRLHYGKLGLDTLGSNWGSNVYLSYKDRERDHGNFTGQGVAGKLTYISLRASWLVNPESNLKVELGTRIRNLDSEMTGTSPVSTGSSTYIYFGLRTEFFNEYYDF